MDSYENFINNMKKNYDKEQRDYAISSCISEMIKYYPKAKDKPLRMVVSKTYDCFHDLFTTRYFIEMIYKTFKIDHFSEYIEYLNDIKKGEICTLKGISKVSNEKIEVEVYDNKTYVDEIYKKKLEYEFNLSLKPKTKLMYGEKFTEQIKAEWIIMRTLQIKENKNIAEYGLQIDGVVASTIWTVSYLEK